MSINLVNWYDFIQSLYNKNPNESISAEDFKSLNLNQIEEETNINKKDFWMGLLNALQNENEFLTDSNGNPINYFRFGHFSDLPINLNNTSSFQDAVLAYIAKNIDLSRIDYINSLKEELLEKNNKTNNNFWNYSIYNLLKYVLLSFDPTFNDYKKREEEEDNPWYTIQITENFFLYSNQVKYGNAAFSFKEDEEWVRSWYNPSGQTYQQVRGNDLNLAAITDKKNLQVTNGTIDYENDDIEEILNTTGIKLIMPMYQREVQIEDLNRNFWVIGQSLTGIAAYLFSEASPIYKSFESIIKELIEIWENILYLWLAFAISMQEEKKVDKVHEEIVYLYGKDFDEPFNNNSFNEIQFKNYLETGNKNEITNMLKKKIEYLKSKYSNYHLVVVPVLYLDNYEINAYSTIYLHGAFILNRNQDQDWNLIYFHEHEIEMGGDSFNPVELSEDEKIYRGIITLKPELYLDGFQNQHEVITIFKNDSTPFLVGYVNDQDSTKQYITVFDDSLVQVEGIFDTYYDSSLPNDSYYHIKTENGISSYYLKYCGINEHNITYYTLNELSFMPELDLLSLHFPENISTYDINTDTIEFNDFHMLVIDYIEKKYIGNQATSANLICYKYNTEEDKIYTINFIGSHVNIVNSEDAWKLKSVSENLNNPPLCYYPNSVFNDILDKDIHIKRLISFNDDFNINSQSKNVLSRQIKFVARQWPYDSNS